MEKNDLANEFLQAECFIDQLSMLQQEAGAFDPDPNAQAKVGEVLQKLKQDMEAGIRHVPSRKKLKLYIRCMQAKLTLLADRCNAFISNGNVVTADGLSPAAMLCEGLLQLLKNLYRYFPNEFDHSRQLPLCFQCQEYHHKLQAVCSGMKAYLVDRELLLVLSAYQDDFYDKASGHTWNWYQYSYYRLLTGHLSAAAAAIKYAEDPTMEMVFTLIACNFNTLSFTRYILVYLSQYSLNDKDGGRPELLVALAERIKMTPKLVKKGCLPEAASVRSTARKYIRIVLKQQSCNDILLSRRDDLQTAAPEIYFETDSSIAELLFVFQLLMHNNCLKTKYHSRLYHFIHQHFHTPGSHQPSEQYMRSIASPGRQVSAKTVQKVKSTLLQLLKDIETRYTDQLSILLTGTLLFHL